MSNEPDRINILIAHQSSLPHYRIDFYNSLSNLAKQWGFSVVYDRENNSNFYKEKINEESFKFGICETKSYIITKTVLFQDFVKHCFFAYDGFVVEDAINNLSYPLGFLLAKFTGKKIIFWGHGRDINILRKKSVYKIKERLKKIMVKRADGYLAYTSGVKDYLCRQGINTDKIFVLNNTIDILNNRKIYDEKKDLAKEYKIQLGLKGCKVLLYVGRIDARKKIEVLIMVFDELYSRDNKFRLIIIGDGDTKVISKNAFNSKSKEAILYLGSIIDRRELVKYYLASDLYFYPGDVGLGPLTSLSFNLPVMVIDSDTHGPEYEYLNNKNSIILDRNISLNEIADKIIQYFESVDQTVIYKKNIWDTIKHLTLENYALNFDLAIRKIFQLNAEDNEKN